MEGMHLDRILKEAGITQAELVRQIGLKQPSVSKWRGRGIPLGRVPDVARITGIPASRINPKFRID